MRLTRPLRAPPAPRWRPASRAPRSSSASAASRPGLSEGVRTVGADDLSRSLWKLVSTTAPRAVAVGSGADSAVAVRVEAKLAARRVGVEPMTIAAARESLYDDRVEAARERTQTLVDRRYRRATRCTAAGAGNPACTTQHGAWTW